jgi:hypothetical protein
MPEIMSWAEWAICGIEYPICAEQVKGGASSGTPDDF